jgi:toxin CptA
MQIVLASLPFLAAAILVGVMGFAIQRGATCTVAAVDEIVQRRTANRLASMVEASLWVVGGLAIAQALFALPKMPAGYALNHLTLAGAVLLGVGATINGACVFGAVARLGSGEWAYVATPLGFYAGCLTVGPLLPALPHTKLDYGSPILQASTPVAALLAGFMLLRIARPLVARDANGALPSFAQRIRAALTSRIWSPHGATAIIGITFVLVLLLVGGTWAYTDALAELARGMAESLPARTALLLALYAGALIGGYTAGRVRSGPTSVAQVAKCFAGGALMAGGTLLIPGSNDGLILIGMPLLWPYAWVAFATMCVSIATAMMAARTFRMLTSAKGTAET